ncbi:MOSC domain-containing protein [Photobacterium sp. SDRW27]|uniref:MOSC domain-containing protein n=1 Tax=Photobacterium obscurum TaxID=2829490 RepID=UPI002242CFC2|nr:MOSC domain-containing protein [Photobacterium obscurum]MCW8329098.1 MOSC domain-containing protein [Photobacterium obscurum]
MYPAATIDEIRLGKIKKIFSVHTGIDKLPVDTSHVTSNGLVGDEQAESFHGGEERAILQFDSEHYQSLGITFPHSSHLLVNGGFGENLVVAGMNEQNMCVGDIVKAGTAVLQITQPRQPCFKLNHRFNEPTMSRYSQDNCQTGWFYRVIKEGTINSGDTIKVTERPYPQWTIARVQHYLYIEPDNKEATEQLADIDVLGDEVKNVFRHRLDNNDVEDWNGRLSGSNTFLEMRVVKIIEESNSVKRFILSRTDLGPLPEFTAGSHITLQLPNGLSRAYSLCAPLADDSYQIAVSYAQSSRGGSKYMHEKVQVGDTLSVSTPQNYFNMARDRHHIFVAAGIGITPFLPMIEEALDNNETFELHYCVDDIDNYAFRTQLSRYSGSVFVYSLKKPLSISALLNSHVRGNHVYTCGSPAFVQRVRDNASHWSDNHVHFESFSVEQSDDESFIVTIKETGQEVEVDSGTSMLDALRNNGVTIDSACETGMCGKCQVDYEGEVEHRDSVLSKGERKRCMTPCVSRAKSKELVISIA